MDSDRLMTSRVAVERFVAMGTRVEFHLFDVPEAMAAMAALHHAVEAVDDALTIHRVSPATILNDRLLAERAAAVDDPLLWEALLLCDTLCQATGGLFDPTAGMGDARWSEIEIDRVNARLRIARPAALDFGGIGKGLALDRCIPILMSAAVPSALLSLGESSILAHGEHPLGGTWPLAIPHPHIADRELIELALQHRCVSVSSTIGTTNGDTLSPTDGAPVRAPMTAVAVDPSGATAEAFSTAFIVADAAQRERLRASGQCEATHLFDLSSDHRPFTVRATGVTVNA